MSQSERLRVGDVKWIYHLVGECRELGIDSRAWRLHAYTRLSDFAGGVIVTGGQSEAPRKKQMDLLGVPVDVGWHCEVLRKNWHDFMSSRRKFEDPLFRRLLAAGLARGVWTREQIIGDREWYRSKFFADGFRVGKGMDASVFSAVVVPRFRSMSWVSMHRPLGQPAFSERWCRLIHTFHGELVPLLGTALATTTDPSPSDLSPRLQTVLASLLEGDSEKQVAARLGLSPYTVHEYVKRVYDHFGARSRAELLGYFLRRSRGKSGLHIPPPA
jgi:DNA-binding CsgD family transcriptional regulator